MVFIKVFKENAKSLLEVRTGRLMFAFGIVDAPKYLIIDRTVGMLVGEAFLVVGDGTLYAHSRTGQVALIPLDHREVGVADREGRVVGRKVLLVDGDGTLHARSCAGQVALIPLDHRQVGVADR